MNNKDLLMQQIEREQAYCNKQETGSEEYVKSFQRLSSLRKEYADLEKSEAENERRNREMADNKKDRIVKNTLEAIKIVGTGIIMPCVGYIVVTAFEKDDSFTSSLKSVVNCFIPKKLN